MNFQTGDFLRFDYHDKPREGVVEKVAVSKKGSPYVTIKVADMDIKEMMFKSFNIFEMENVCVTSKNLNSQPTIGQ